MATPVVDSDGSKRHNFIRTSSQDFQQAHRFAIEKSEQCARILSEISTVPLALALTMSETLFTIHGS